MVKAPRIQHIGIDLLVVVGYGDIHAHRFLDQIDRSLTGRR